MRQLEADHPAMDIAASTYCVILHLSLAKWVAFRQEPTLLPHCIYYFNASPPLQYFPSSPAQIWSHFLFPKYQSIIRPNHTPPSLPTIHPTLDHRHLLEVTGRQEVQLLLNFYKYKQPMRLFLFLCCLLVGVRLQETRCYANCKEGSCLPANALNCTACDLGLLNLNGACIGSSQQAPPLTYFKPNARNQLTDAPNALACQVKPASISIPMSFAATIGNSFSRAFSIPYSHIFLQIKLNAVVLGAPTAPFAPTVLLNVYALDLNIHSAVRSLAGGGSRVSCNNSQLAEDVITINEKFKSTDTNIIMEIKVSGAFDASLALTDLEIYYGNCSATCEQCFGPTETECLTCKGLLTTLAAGVCKNCPQGFYLDGVCQVCPLQCNSCAKSASGVLECQQCNPELAKPVESSVSPLKCQIAYFQRRSQNSLKFGSSEWYSSQTGGSAVSQCGYYSLIGGISIGVAGSSLSHLYTDLPAHTVLYLTFTLFLSGQTLGDTHAYQLEVDGEQRNPSVVVEAPVGTQLTNECDSPGYEMAVRQTFQFNHTGGSALVRIGVLKDYFSLRDVVLVVNNQTAVANCLTELKGVCVACRNGLALANGTCSKCLPGYYLRDQLCQICPITCKTCELDSSNAVVCLTCPSPLQLEGRFCVDTGGSLFAGQVLQQVPASLGDWSFYPHLQKKGEDRCGASRILGSSDYKYKFLKMSRTFRGLASHQGIMVMLHFYQIDDYPENSTTYLQLDGKKFPYTPSPLKMQLCGNSSFDAVVPLYLQDGAHAADTLTISVVTDSAFKLGISDIMVFLLNSGTADLPFTMQVMPKYSISTPPVKGITVKLIFPQKFVNTTDLSRSFLFSLAGQSRLLASSQDIASQIPIVNGSYNNPYEVAYQLELTKDHNGGQLEAVTADPTRFFFTDGQGNSRLASQAKQTLALPRYVEIDEKSVTDRSSLRNLLNLFRGCAILALFIGLVSFLFALSHAFDDFLLLCQILFVHIFIQLDYNPPSIRIPFQGLHIVQFLEWLPWQARQAIEKGLIPGDLVQHSPIAYEQYFQDIVFARTAYQSILCLALLFTLWGTCRILLLVWDSKNSKHKYTNYAIHYYHSYDSRTLCLFDRIIRFVYFPLAWACVLQCTHFDNSPTGFHAWNSAVTIVVIVGLIVYPLVVFWRLRRAVNSMSISTFEKSYEDMRVSGDRLFYFIFRYYKLIAIACSVGFLHSSNALIPLILLLIFNFADALLLLLTKPLGMKQAELPQAPVFYPYYPRIYQITTVIQQCLFIVLEILWLVLYGQRSSASSSTYMGVGYVICGLAILLLINGLLRMIWGVIKSAQHFYLQREAWQQSVEKEVDEKRDPAEQHPMIDDMYKSQAAASRRELSSFPRPTSKKMSFVSKLRI